MIANGHAYVDLGLPSGTLWATMNVGASSETDYGNYYKYGLGASQYDNAQTNYTGTETTLASNADTATQVWGGQWHMPTLAQFDELIRQCDWTWGTRSGINGYIVSKNGESIFFPAGGDWTEGSQYSVGSSGFYWSSTSNSSENAFRFCFSSVNKYVDDHYGRYYGLCVRPVLDSYSNQATNVASKVAMTGSYNDLTDKPTIPTVPTKISDLTNDSGYIPKPDLNANGHAYVDLDLPSGTLWATMNIGASSETDSGLYFQWGDTQGYNASQIGDGSG